MMKVAHPPYIFKKGDESSFNNKFGSKRALSVIKFYSGNCLSGLGIVMKEPSSNYFKAKNFC